MRPSTSTSHGIGQRLVRAIPPELQHPEFRYTFRVVNQKEINAFALPGGPMFLNRGMIEASHDEGEIAGVMAHEMSHVMLRHGTAQATKATRIPDRRGGRADPRRDRRRHRRQHHRAGIELRHQHVLHEVQPRIREPGGHQWCAADGPRRATTRSDMANMFKTLEAQGGSSGPEWLSDHPNPGNRYQRINQGGGAAARDEQQRGDTAEFNRVQARLKGMSPALTAQQIAQQNQRSGTATVGTDEARGERRAAVRQLPHVSAEQRACA